MDMKLFSTRILQARKDMNLTQKRLSELSGVSQATISEYESSKVSTTPGIDNVFKLSKTLGVSIDYLLGMSDSKLIDISDEEFTYKNEYKYKMIPIENRPEDFNPGKKKSVYENYVMAPTRVELNMYYYCNNHKMYPVIQNGDVMGIKKIKPENGDIVLVKFPEGNTEFCNYSLGKGIINLSFSNPAFKALNIEKREFEEKYMYYGVVVSVIRFFKYF